MSESTKKRPLKKKKKKKKKKKIGMNHKNKKTYVYNHSNPRKLFRQQKKNVNCKIKKKTNTHAEKYNGTTGIFQKN